MRKLPVLITLCLVSVTAHAADNGFYVGAGIGGSNTSTDGSGPESETGYKLIGGFRLLDSLALEVNYLDFGKVGIQDRYPQCGGQICGVGDSASRTGLSGFAVGFLHFPVLDAFAKLGVAKVEAKTRVSGVSGKNDTTDVAWGAGVQAHFGSFALRGEYEQYKYKLNLGYEVRLFSVSFLYTFL